MILPGPYVADNYPLVTANSATTTGQNAATQNPIASLLIWLGTALAIMVVVTLAPVVRRGTYHFVSVYP